MFLYHPPFLYFYCILDVIFCAYIQDFVVMGDEHEWQIKASLEATWRNDNVTITSKRCRDVVLT